MKAILTPKDDWTAPEVKHLHEICQTNAALIGELPEAGRKAIEAMWSELPDAETGELPKDGD